VLFDALAKEKGIDPQNKESWETFNLSDKQLVALMV